MTAAVLPANAFQPMFHTSLGEDAVDLAMVCGLNLDEWQSEVVKTSLTFTEDGMHAARQMLLLVPRQQGKNVCIEARELAGLFLLREKNILHTAHEYRTAQASFMRLKERIEAGGEYLTDLCEDGTPIRYRNSGAETSVLVPESGKGVGDQSYIIFTPRTKGAGRGLTIEMLIVDEAYALTAQQTSALRPTQNQAQNPQVWYTSSTGFEDSEELLALRSMGLNKIHNMGFFEWKADDKSDPGDREQWYKALPGLSTGRQRIAEIETQYEAAKAKGDFTDFERETLGLWASTDLDPVISEKHWNSTFATEEDFEGDIAFAIDVAPDQSSAAIYAAGVNKDGQYLTKMAAIDNGTQWVAEYARQLQDKYNPKSIALDTGGPANSIVTELDMCGVKFTSMGASDVLAACGQFYNMVTGFKMQHIPDEDLDNARKGGIKRMVGPKGSWAWARKSPEYNITPLVAATYAVYAFTAFEPEKPKGGRVW